MPRVHAFPQLIRTPALRVKIDSAELPVTLALGLGTWACSAFRPPPSQSCFSGGPRKPKCVGASRAQATPLPCTIVPQTHRGEPRGARASSGLAEPVTGKYRCEVVA